MDGKPQGLLFFGESPADESYHFPDKLAKTKLLSRAADGKLIEVATSKVDTEDRVGLIGPLTDEKATVLQASQQYGIYGTALLIYDAKSVRGRTADEINSAGTSKELGLEIVPKIADGKVTCKVLRAGKPVADADVSIFAGDKEPQEEKTDKDGEVNFRPKGVGVVGVLANTMDDEKTGKLDGKSYKGVLRYASLTLQVPKDLSAVKSKSSKEQKTKKVDKETSEFAPLPEPLASFGGVVLDGWLYVYGGHIGEEHQHSAANLSNHFRRIKLNGGKTWEELPMQTPLQGLPLVAHGGKLYRVGGLGIRNATLKDKEDDHSSAEFAEYNPATNKWSTLAPLPAARSSHNAVVIGDRLYVVGGWNLEGKSPGTWEPDALFYDFANAKKGWQKLPQPEFKRRALALGQWNEKLLAMGGMNEKADVSMDVFVYDPATGKWSKGPNLPGAGMAGFGVSAWNLGGHLFECGLRGVLYELNDAGTAWDEAGHVKTPRFFHQLIPVPNGGLAVVGGASMSGHLDSIERVETEAQKAISSKL
jgi:N-acetylneuraminic acid mutarotase